MPQNSWFYFLQRRTFILKLKLGQKRNKVGWKLQKETQQSMFYISSFPKVCLTLSPPSWESLGFWLPDGQLQHPFLLSHPFTPCRSTGAEQAWPQSCSSVTHSVALFLLFRFQIQGMTALPPDIERPYQAEPLVCGASSTSLRGNVCLELLLSFVVLGSTLSTRSFCP